MQLQTRRAVAYACTCGLTAASSSLRLQNPRRWMQASSSSSQAGPSSEVYDAEDYHDPAHAQMLTARLAKTKKRMVKRVRLSLPQLQTACTDAFRQGQDFVDKLTIQVKAGEHALQLRTLLSLTNDSFLRQRRCVYPRSMSRLQLTQIHIKATVAWHFIAKSS
jgi:hypothetical protein